LNFVIFYVGKSAESWTLLFSLAKFFRKVGLCHFYWRKKLGKLNFIIFNGGKRCRKLDFVIFDGGKVWKIGLCHFLCWIKLGKLDFDFFNVGKSSESLTQSFLGQKKHFFVEKLI
jgi:hypothetical protein